MEICVSLAQCKREKEGRGREEILCVHACIPSQRNTNICSSQLQCPLLRSGLLPPSPLWVGLKISLLFKFKKIRKQRESGSLEVCAREELIKKNVFLSPPPVLLLF